MTTTTLSPTNTAAALPKGWKWMTLGEVIEPLGLRVDPSSVPHFPYIGMEHVESQTMKILGTVLAGTMKSSVSRFYPGNVLYGRLRPYLNKVTRPTFEGVASSEFIVFQENEKVSAHFLQYILNSSDFVAFANMLDTGDRPRVNFEQIKSYRLAVPPLPVQHAIAARLDAQLSLLEATASKLKTLQKKLKRYRQALLKAAVTGELTRRWRESQGPAAEAAPALLERILRERRKAFCGRGKYAEPQAPDTVGLPALPEGWCWASVEQVIHKIEAGKSFSCDERPPQDGETGLVKISAVTWGEFDEEESKTVTNPEMIFDHLHIKRGDFLFSRANTLELIGAPVIVNNISKKLMLSDKVLRVAMPNNHKTWLMHWMKSIYGRKEIEARATGNQLSMRNISQDAFGSIPIPLPPLAEQQRIVAELENRFTLLDRLESQINHNLKRTDALKQAALKKGFSNG